MNVHTFDLPTWWPPKVGDRLRGIWGPHAKNDPLERVVAVFEHAGRHHVVTACWLPRRARWTYETYGESAAIVGRIRPDKTPRKRQVTK